MKKRIWILVILVFIGLLGAKAVIKITQNRAVSKEWGERGGQRGAAVTVVKTEAVKTGSITQTLDLVGSIEPETEVAIQPMISGRLLTFGITEGQYVNAGTVVGEIDSETLRVQIEQARANLAQIKANVQQAEINMNKLRIERARNLELLDKKYISQSAFDAVDASYQSAQAALNSVKAQQASSERSFELLQIQMRHTRVVAPASGYVLKTFTTPGAHLTTGTTVATIVPLNRVKLVFQLDQTQASELKEGMMVTFKPDETANKQGFRGTIKSIAPIYDAETRSLEFSTILNNSEKALLPGMFGRVDVVLGTRENVLLIPEEALVQESGRGQGVYRVASDNIARFQAVTLGLRSKGQVEVISGLAENDRIVVVGQNRLRDGQEVQQLGSEKQNGWGEERSGHRGRGSDNGRPPRGKGRPSNSQRRGGDWQ